MPVVEALEEVCKILRSGLTKQGFKPEFQERGIKAVAKVLELIYRNGINVHTVFASLEYENFFHQIIESSYLQESLLIDETPDWTNEGLSD